MLLVLFLAFTLIPLAEIYLLIQVGQVIGTWDTIALVIFSGIIGAYAAKTQGRQVLGDIETQLKAGQEPSVYFLQAVLVFVGGILLITPGFITDIFGMSFILPWTRSFYIKGLAHLFKKGIHLGKIHVYTGANSSTGPYDPFATDRPRSSSYPDNSRSGSLSKDADVIDISSYRNKD